MWLSPIHRQYVALRDYVHFRLSNDFLVYAPFRAWRGPWNDVAQEVNNLAIAHCDAFVEIQIPGIVATGTDEERDRADEYEIPIYTIIMRPENDWGISAYMNRVTEVHDAIAKLR
jgi:hypothetical protein